MINHLWISFCPRRRIEAAANYLLEKIRRDNRPHNTPDSLNIRCKRNIAFLLGKVFHFNTNNFTLTQQSSFLAHSIVSLFGNKIKLNPNLISCTYFSGLQSYKKKWIISYGVNDIQWKIKCLNKL